MSVKKQLKDVRFTNDEAYKKIQKSCIKMDRREIIACNQILKKVILDEVINRMREEDDDFNELYEGPMFGRSFYKNLKVKEPNEFDLCLKINLCKSIKRKHLKIVPDNCHPSYVKIKIRHRKFHGNENFWNKILNKNNYLNQNEFRSWIQGILDRTFTEYQGTHKGYIIEFQRREIYYLHNHQSGPAFTIHLVRQNDGKEIDFDLVPCLVFEKQFLPGFRPRQSTKWIAIAKPKKPDTIWRAGFFNDEKKILAGQIKPIARMVKKLRDVYDWKHLKSYFIETLFYHELDKKQNPYFACKYFKHPRTAVFMYMIRQLQQKLKSQKLFDYWHEKFNLLNAINQAQALKMANDLTCIIDFVEKNIEEDSDIL